MISMMFEASRRVWYFTTSTSGLMSWIGLLGGVDLRHADAVVGVGDLALEVGQVDHVVVHDPERAHAGGGEVEGGGRAEPAGAEQQDLGVEQLELALDADLGDEQVARVALALLGGQLPRDLDVVAAVLPQRDAARSSTRRSRSRAPPGGSWPRGPSGCPTRSRGPRAGPCPSRRPRCAIRDDRAARARRPGCGPPRTPSARARRRSPRRCGGRAGRGRPWGPPRGSAPSPCG